MTAPGAARAIKAAGAPRRGLSRIEAAVYVGVGITKFDEMVADGRMPGARLIDGRKVWDIRRLDVAFENLPEQAEGDGGSWSDR
jgi:excisionase family DNA binding protein